MEVTSLSNPVSYVDHIGFVTQFGHEMDQISKMDAIEHEGKYFVHMLYSFRSVSNAIPMVVSLQTYSICVVIESLKFFKLFVMCVFRILTLIQNYPK